MPSLRRRDALAWIAASASALAGCRRASAPSGKLRVQLDWVPEPEFGGLYEARASGAFAREGLEVELVGGGPSTPVVQLVASGGEDLGVVAGEELVVARARGVDLVAIYATYQSSPQGIMVHASRGLRRLEELEGGSLALDTGAPFGAFVQAKFPLSKVTIVSTDGGVAKFLSDQRHAQQCFVTSEPVAAKQAGSDPQVFTAKSLGFDSYANVVVARGEALRGGGDRARAMVRALQAGWRGYLSSPARANAQLASLNRAMDAATFAQVAEAQRPLVESDDTRALGLGAMRAGRWKALIDQLVAVKIIGADAAPKPEACFVFAT